jgi:hypothetical protein
MARLAKTIIAILQGGVDQAAGFREDDGRNSHRFRSLGLHAIHVVHHLEPVLRSCMITCLR